MCSSWQPSVVLCSSLGREGGSRTRKAIALLYVPPWGELAAMLFVAWFGNSPCRHLLLAWEHTWADEGRGWDHCLCPRDFEEAQLLREWTGSPVTSSGTGSALLLLGVDWWPWPFWRGLCQHKHLNLH